MTVINHSSVEQYDEQLETIAGFTGTPTPAQLYLTLRQLAWFDRYMLHFFFAIFAPERYEAHIADHPLGPPPQ